MTQEGGHDESEQPAKRPTVEHGKGDHPAAAKSDGPRKSDKSRCRPDNDGRPVRANERCDRVPTAVTAAAEAMTTAKGSDQRAIDGRSSAPTHRLGAMYNAAPRSDAAQATAPATAEETAV